MRNVKHAACRLAVASVALVTMSAPAVAQVTIYGSHLEDTPKRSHSLGVKGYVQAIGDSDNQSEFQGFGIIGTTTLLPADDRDLVLRASYSLMDSTDEFEPEGDNIEVALLWGGGLRNQGFKWYFGGGYFREEWDFPYLIEGSDGFYQTESESLTVSNWLATSGIGYNWSRVGIDLWVTYKHGNKYNEPFSDVSAAASVGGSITFRF